ncbi:remorin isoform X2 [Cannabis sativa]|uniref:remorin isoform X2 n=1 Tax=Cannabis sativa TaxID=3483 RepID=UPI0029CA26D8|nr:remorin isoform X2 [Cannabis sativa]
MAEEEAKRVEPQSPENPSPVAAEQLKKEEAKEEEEVVNSKDVCASDEKSLSPVPLEKPLPAPAIVQIVDPFVEKNSEVAVDRDAVLARVEAEKRLALIKAWEESEKTKADNKAYKKLSAVESWENSKRAAVEAELKQIEEKLEKKRAEYTEKMKNKVVELHKIAEEKRAMVEANRQEEFLKVEETAAKFRASGYSPKKFFACFSA